MLTSRQTLLPSLDTLLGALGQKAREFADIVKIGRTHTQDATPLTLGQKFSGYCAQIASCRERIKASLDRDLSVLAIGGTAVGTGLNAPQGWRDDMVQVLCDPTGEQFRPAKNAFERSWQSSNCKYGLEIRHYVKSV